MTDETERRFEQWIECLDVEVIQHDHGFEEGEFEVFPEHWRPLYDEGLTPQEAFARALKAHREDQT